MALCAEDLKQWVKEGKVYSCERQECNKLLQLQKEQQEKDPEKKNFPAPLPWQGNARENIDLIFLGGNPSVVGSWNEPLRDWDFERRFEEYFNYYQHREESEIQGGKTLDYWNDCEGIARSILGKVARNLAGNLQMANDRVRWKDYILMEVIHCFFNEEKDLIKHYNPIAKLCSTEYTVPIIDMLRPKGLVIMGKKAHDCFIRLTDRPADKLSLYKTDESVKVKGRVIPAFRIHHPSARRWGYWVPPTDPLFRQFGERLNCN